MGGIYLSKYGTEAAEQIGVLFRLSNYRLIASVTIQQSRNFVKTDNFGFNLHIYNNLVIKSKRHKTRDNDIQPEVNVSSSAIVSRYCQLFQLQ